MQQSSSSGFVLLASGEHFGDTTPRVLLLESARVGIEGRWSLPRGTVEPGERMTEAAVRELAEETGIVADQIRTVPGFYFSYAGEEVTKFQPSEEIVSKSYTYQVRVFLGDPTQVQSSHEHRGRTWIPLHDVFKAPTDQWAYHHLPLLFNNLELSLENGGFDSGSDTWLR